MVFQAGSSLVANWRPPEWNSCPPASWARGCRSKRLAPGLPGLTIRDSFGTKSGRFSADYVIPNGCVWAAQCRLPADGIQSNRTQGPEVSQEFRALSLSPKYTMRLGGKLAFYHFCDQANPLVIVPRTCHFANTMALTLRLELGGKDQWY